MRILFFSYLVFSSFILSGQSGLGTWNIINLKYNIGKKLSFLGEAQIRSLKFFDNFHYYEYKGGINWNIHANVKLALGAGSYQTYAEGGNFEIPKNNDEFRIWPQVVLFHSLNALKIEQRYRADLRFTINGYKNRFRYRFAASYPLGIRVHNKKPLQASLSNELFLTDNAPYFERNRVSFTLNYHVSRHSMVQVGFLHQFDYKINDESGRDFLVLGYYYEISSIVASGEHNKGELRDD